jgi:DNA-binding CsgD family transcriptional regulator
MVRTSRPAGSCQPCQLSNMTGVICGRCNGTALCVASMEDIRQADYLSLAEATTQEQLAARLVQMARLLEFETVSLTAVVDRPQGHADFFSVGNTPLGHLEEFNDLTRGKLDPVSQHCKRSHVPIAWDQSTYVLAGQGELWEKQSRFGYLTGISAAHHLANGKHVWVGVDRTEQLPELCGPQRVRLMAAVQMVATYAIEASLALMFPAESSFLNEALLTDRECEVLRWTMDGKTAWEIGRILGIAENTAIRHAHSASRKLGCSSKHHAVVKALRLGLIQ